MLRLAGYRVPAATASTLALFDSYEHNNRVQFVADQAADRGFHHGDAKTTSSTGSQSPPGFPDVIVSWFFSASVVRQLQMRIN